MKPAEIPKRKIKYEDITHFLHITFISMFQEELRCKIKRTKVKKAISKILGDFPKEDVFHDLEQIKLKLKHDVDFFMEADPASLSREEVIATYPGLHAIFAYRIAHYLDDLGIAMVPRMITEIAHSKTGIDIHPKANIGCPFFIDHGTGIVIGETAIIGDEVRLYHGVTLGALNLEHGNHLQGIKRHPTIGNHVIVYANATILGGDTQIGDQTTIGCNVIVTHNVERDTLLYLKDNQMIQKKKSH